MGIGIESLFTANAPKSVNYIRQGGNPEYTREEKLFILGQVQRQQPLGSAILTAQIAQCKKSRSAVVAAVRAHLMITGQLDCTTAHAAIADCATAEVCDSPACKHCSGTGKVFNDALLFNARIKRAALIQLQGKINCATRLRQIALQIDDCATAIHRLDSAIAAGDIVTECKQCHGTGRKIIGKEALHCAIATNISYQTFIKRYYDIYMDAVDMLHKEASKAAGCAKYIAESAS